MRISDWSSDVCSSDLLAKFWATVSEEHNVEKFQTVLHDDLVMWYNFDPNDRSREEFIQTLKDAHAMFQAQKNETMRITLTAAGFILQSPMTGVREGTNISDRQSVGEGKGVSCRGDLGVYG